MCMIKECDLPEQSLGLCSGHLRRIKRGMSVGDPLRSQRPKDYRPLEEILRDALFIEWFYAQAVRSENGCLEWGRRRDSDGYGHYTVGGRPHGAHRLAWAIEHGGIMPDSKTEIRHLVCDNPPCIDVSHLAEGTHKENIDDRERKGRGRKSKGVCFKGHPMEGSSVRNGKPIVYCLVCARERSARRYHAAKEAQ